MTADDLLGRVYALPSGRLFRVIVVCGDELRGRFVETGERWRCARTDFERVLRAGAVVEVAAA